MKLSVSVVFAATFTIGTTQANAADPPSDVLAAFGLTGTWSAACDQPVGPRNPRIRYEQRPDGQVDAVGDFGGDGPSRSTILEAYIDQDKRLHAMSYATFDDLPKAIRDAFAKSGSRPSVMNRNILAMAADGSLTTEDSFADIEGSPDALHIIAGGYVVDPATQAPGPKVPPRFRCPD